MKTSTLEKLNQPTIGPDDLDRFISVLDDVHEIVDAALAEEIDAVARELRASLAAWTRLAERGINEQNASESKFDPQALRPPELSELHNIDRHLQRLILRHSNFGFAAANMPSDLDKYFPSDALLHLRVARARLRRVLSELAAGDRMNPRSLSV